MANAAIAYANLADAGSITASSQQVLMPATKLLTSDVSDRWRSASNSAFVVLDLLSSTSLDSLMLRGLTVGSTATIRARLSSADSSGLAGDLFDSGTLTAGASAYFDANYGAFVYPLGSPVSARYLRFDINDPSATYVEAGRIAAMLRASFGINFGYGWQTQWVDRSVRQKSRGGQSLVWIDNAYRTLDLTFENLTPAERYGLVEAIDRVNGQRTDILFIIDTASANIARDSIFGLVSDLTPVIQSTFNQVTKQYKIEERL